MSNNFSWNTGFVLPVHDMTEDPEKWSVRRLSQVKGIFQNADEAERMLEQSDPVIYEFQELGAPEHEGDLAFGSGRLYPGMVGEEYYMTKGHFHQILMTAEVYLCLAGEGLLLIESPDGSDTRALEMKPMQAVYVPKGYAHRTINTGKTVLEYFFAFRGDAGHDYGTIERKGFRKLITVSENGWRMADNPNYL